MEEYIQRLKQDIEEREKLLDKLSQDHWLYNMQKLTLEQKRKEYYDLTSERTSINQRAFYASGGHLM